MKRLISVACMLCLVTTLPAIEWIDPSTLNWRWQALSDGTIALGGGWAASASSPTRAVPVTTAGALEIPAEINGRKVSVIYDYAFYECTGLTAVKIPEGVTQINSQAFRGCTCLTHIELPTTLSAIGSAAFSNVPVTTLKAHQFPLEDGYGSATMSAEGIKTIIIPEEAIYLPNDTFSECTALENVIFEGLPPMKGTNVFPDKPVTASYNPQDVQAWNLQIAAGKWDPLVFESDSVIISINILGLGTITTTAEDGNINSFPKNESTDLTATPGDGYVFMGWSGDVVSPEATISLTGEEHEQYQLTALFLPRELIKTIAKEMASEEKLVTNVDVETAVNTIISNKLQSKELIGEDDATLAAEAVVQNKINNNELVTRQQINSLSMETPLIDVTHGKGTISLTLKKATTLSGDTVWKNAVVTEPGIDINGNITVDITPDEGENTAFYKFVADPEAQAN